MSLHTYVTDGVRPQDADINSKIALLPDLQSHPMNLDQVCRITLLTKHVDECLKLPCIKVVGWFCDSFQLPLDGRFLKDPDIIRQLRGIVASPHAG